MEIRFPACLLVQSFAEIKKALQMSLNKQQQKIVAIAVVIFSLIAAVIVYRKFFSVNKNPENGYGEKVLTYIYRGEFKNGRLNGPGEIVQPNGDIHRGTFVDGVIQDDGNWIRADGKPAPYGAFMNGHYIFYENARNKEADKNLNA